MLRKCLMQKNCSNRWRCILNNQERVAIIRKIADQLKEQRKLVLKLRHIINGQPYKEDDHIITLRKTRRKL